MRDSEKSSNHGKPNHDSSASNNNSNGNENDNFQTWDEIFRGAQKRAQDQTRANRKSTDVVGENYYRRSLHNTWFDVLTRHPAVKEAYLIMSGGSVNLSENQDLLFVIRPETFPHIEVRVLEKSLGSDAPRLVRGFTAEYEIGGHKGGGINGKYWDVIRLPNGNYLLPPSDMVGSGYQGFVVESLSTGGTRAMLKSNFTGAGHHFLEMAYSSQYNRYGATERFFMVDPKPYDYMPKSRALETWKNIKIIEAGQSVIQLGYECKVMLK